MQELIRAGAKVDVRSKDGYTPLAWAISNNGRDCAELLLDSGAKMSNVLEKVKIPSWVTEIVTKRQNVKRGLWAFIGVLRKRFLLGDAGLEHIGGRLPRDVINMLSRWVWATRFDPRWRLAVPDTIVIIK